MRSGEAACPTGQKQHVRPGEGSLAIAPGNLLDDDGMAPRTIHAPHGVQQEHHKAPEGNEFETALGELVVSRSRLLAAGTDGPGSFARTDRDFDALVIGAEAGPLINKSLEVVAAI
jgi:hypothetical protein